MTQDQKPVLMHAHLTDTVTGESYEKYFALVEHEAAEPNKWASSMANEWRKTTPVGKYYRLRITRITDRPALLLEELERREKETEIDLKALEKQKEVLKRKLNILRRLNSREAFKTVC